MCDIWDIRRRKTILNGHTNCEANFVKLKCNFFKSLIELFSKVCFNKKRDWMIKKNVDLSCNEALRLILWEEPAWVSFWQTLAFYEHKLTAESNYLIY